MRIEIITSTKLRAKQQKCSDEPQNFKNFNKKLGTKFHYQFEHYSNDIYYKTFVLISKKIIIFSYKCASVCKYLFDQFFF